MCDMESSLQNPWCICIETELGLGSLTRPAPAHTPEDGLRVTRGLHWPSSRATPLLWRSCPLVAENCTTVIHVQTNERPPRREETGAGIEATRILR